MAAQSRYRQRADRRAQMIAEITNDLRRYSVAAQHVGHAFAGLHGLNATDLDALLAVTDAELVGDPITPGRLGERLDLSSGSVTALIDRLERAGHVRRDRDTADRRKVFLRYADQGAELARSFFDPLGRRTDQVMAGFSDEELAVVHRFMTDMVVSMGEHRDAVRAARGEPPKRAADTGAAGRPVG
ncbi:MarR family winged helix-turn-helix transcriptional regulator [Micromonospora sp. NPDC005806]|uniref:MarR family winged helix-turn-helix transcriptional regulator n=1 Tax=Micromonospora sp. NPDC005806 TaxID=3364234 RepID=UPI0036AEC5CD